MLRNLHVITTRGGLMRILSSSSSVNAAKQPKAVAPTQHRSSLTSHPETDQRLTADSTLSADEGMQVPGSDRSDRSNRSEPLEHRLDGGRAAAAKEIGTSDALTLLAMYLSAIVHDYDHRGVTNAFLIQDEDPLAVRGEGGGQRW